jgi:hypothetical protein
MSGPVPIDEILDRPRGPLAPDYSVAPPVEAPVAERAAYDGVVVANDLVAAKSHNDH